MNITSLTERQIDFSHYNNMHSEHFNQIPITLIESTQSCSGTRYM
jgi:hypothetical protein